MSWCLEWLDIPKSSFYRHCSLQPEPAPFARYRSLRARVVKIVNRHPAYGYRRIKDALRKQKIIINHKPLKKLLKYWNLEKKRWIRSPRPSPLAQSLKELGAKANLVAKINNLCPFRVLLTDFTELEYLAGTAQFIPFSDLSTKRIAGWNIGPSDDTANALKAWDRSKCYLARIGKNLSEVIVHQDQDPVFTGYEYVGRLLADGVTLSFTERGFKDNPWMESFIGHFKEEYRNLLSQAKTLAELKKILVRCVRDWNKNRIHSVLKGRSPDEFIHTVCKFKKS